MQVLKIKPSRSSPHARLGAAPAHLCPFTAVLLRQPILSQLAAPALRVLLNKPRKIKTGNDFPHPPLLLTNAI